VPIVKRCRSVQVSRSRRRPRALRAERERAGRDPRHVPGSSPPGGEDVRRVPDETTGARVVATRCELGFTPIIDRWGDAVYLRSVIVRGFRASAAGELSCSFPGRFSVLLGANNPLAGYLSRRVGLYMGRPMCQDCWCQSRWGRFLL